MQSQNFFTTMVDAVQSPSATGLTWCNDTPHKIMAAVATDDGKSVVSRGWYRIEPGKCLHPDVTGNAEAGVQLCRSRRCREPHHQAQGQAVELGRRTELCTRESKFETNEQGDCPQPRFCGDGFAAVDLTSGGKTLRFAMP